MTFEPRMCSDSSVRKRATALATCLLGTMVKHAKSKSMGDFTDQLGHPVHVHCTTVALYWNFTDVISLPSPDFAALANTAQLKVDLRKAQEACERLSEQLIEAETARDTFESRLGDQVTTDNCRSYQHLLDTNRS